jgi:hypothetical protein
MYSVCDSVDPGTITMIQGIRVFDSNTRFVSSALLSGMQLTTRSVLPLWDRASLQFNWGLRMPPELLVDGASGRGKKGAPRAPVSKMPLLVSIEQSLRAIGADGKDGRAETDAPDGSGDGGAPAFSLVRRQLESLNVDNMLLRRAMEDLCAEIGAATKPRSCLPPPLPEPKAGWR